MHKSLLNTHFAVCISNASSHVSWLFNTIACTVPPARMQWHPAGMPCNVTTGATTLVEQCRQIKAVDPTTKCFVYRNTELALEWLEPQRAVMDDPTKASFFLRECCAAYCIYRLRVGSRGMTQVSEKRFFSPLSKARNCCLPNLKLARGAEYQPGNPGGVPAGTIYNEDAGGPGSGCRQYFWNYSNPDVVEYVLAVSEQGVLGTGSKFVDGTFLDDSQAIPQEHGSAPTNMGLTPTQLAILQSEHIERRRGRSSAKRASQSPTATPP